MAQDSQNFIPVPPDLNAWIRLMFQAFSASFNCVSLATVNTFDAATQTVNLTINYVRVFKNANPNLPQPAAGGQTSDVLLPYPVLIQCPVFIIQGGGAYLTMPIKPGDTGLVLFNDREITTWLKTGQVVPPQNQRTHDLSDGIYFGGIRNLLNVIANYNTTFASLTDTSGERLNVTGDIKPSIQTANHSGWLLMNGQTIGNTGSGADNTGPQYESLFTLLGGTGWSSGGIVAVDDIREYTIAGYKAGDPTFGTFRSKIGESTHTLTIPEIPSHDHGILGPADELSLGNDAFNFGSGSSITSGQTGGDGAHNNIQQTYIANWFIKI